MAKVQAGDLGKSTNGKRQETRAFCAFSENELISLPLPTGNSSGTHVMFTNTESWVETPL